MKNDSLMQMEFLKNEKFLTSVGANLNMFRFVFSFLILGKPNEHIQTWEKCEQRMEFHLNVIQTLVSYIQDPGNTFFYWV